MITLILWLLMLDFMKGPQPPDDGPMVGPEIHVTARVPKPPIPCRGTL